jgi:phage N-6-adenine-methyltransferase
MAKTMPRQKRGESKQTYGTPRDFLDAVRKKFGIRAFAFDLAATKRNAVAPRYFTQTDNALVQPWHRVGHLPYLKWLNPPFDRLAPWAEKSWIESQLGCELVMLTPAAVGSNWWRDFVDGKAHVYLLNGRITFVGQTQPYPKDCVLLHYGPFVRPGYSVWSWKPARTRKAAK